MKTYELIGGPLDGETRELASPGLRFPMREPIAVRWTEAHEDPSPTPPVLRFGAYVPGPSFGGIPCLHWRAP
jgi:hypothetical protein